MNNKLKLAALLAVSAFSTPALASLTYSTGADADLDGKDDRFTVNNAAAFLVTSAANGWPTLPAAAVTSGRYISWHPVQSGRSSSTLRNATYDYGFQFNWGDASTTTKIDFRWISDDYLTDILLNGTSLGVNNLGANNVWTISNSATVLADVFAGTNTIQFLVNNVGGGANGLAADFTIRGNATNIDASVPEPSSIALLGLGLAIAFTLNRKRR